MGPIHWYSENQPPVQIEPHLHPALLTRQVVSETCQEAASCPGISQAWYGGDTFGGCTLRPRSLVLHQC
jgi:hypothetical protein